MNSITRHGYLVIADISGYTSFVAQTELEHSHEIISDLLTTVCERLETLLALHKLEGDAVFVYAAEENIPRGELLLDLIESTYTAFRDRQVSMKRGTTCTCQACQNVPSLDLKIIAHHGDYIIQDVMGMKEMIGSDVNLVHRLLKNHLSEATGWRAYMMFTEPCLQCMDVKFDDAHVQVESYEHLDDVTTYSIDLHKRYEEIKSARRVFLTESDADIILVQDFEVPPPVAWEWMQEPEKRNLWSSGVTWSVGDRPKGRMGSGASNHCAHGKGVSSEMVLDWRPFDYVTSESFEGGKKTMTTTSRFEALPDGRTRLYDLVKVEMPLPRPLRRIVVWIMMKVIKIEKMYEKAARLAKEEYERTRRGETN
jgi:hypothetical protein